MLKKSLIVAVALAVTMLAALLTLTSCNEADEPVGSSATGMQKYTVSVDRGNTHVVEVPGTLTKPLNGNAYCPLTGCRIAYDMSHDNGRQYQTAPSGSDANSTIFGDYIARGATISEITTFTASVLAEFDVLWLEEDWYGQLSNQELNDMRAFAAQGGSVIVVGDEWGRDATIPATPLMFFGYGYDGTPASGIATQIGTHPITSGVASVEFSYSQSGLTTPSGGFTTLVWNSAGTVPYMIVQNVGRGLLIIVSDELFMNSIVLLQDNRVLGNQMLSHAYRRQVPIDIKPGGWPNSINCNKPNGIITVAVLTTPDFDALSVDHTTVGFMGAHETHINKKTGLPQRHEEDVDNDGDLDLVFHFRFGDTAMHCSSTEGHMTGMTYCGGRFHGMDYVSMVP